MVPRSSAGLGEKRGMPFLHQNYFLIPLLCWTASQCAKLVFARLRGGEWTTGVFGSGGFPSSHSAFVTSLLVLVGTRSGLDSVLFAVAFSLACIVWYDALTTRRVLGEQGRQLNRLQSELRFKERMGHNLLEVAAGGLLGVLLTLLMLS